MEGSHEQGDHAYAPIADVARAYGVSVDTIRRRIRRGDLQGRKEQTAQGFRWLAAMPAPGETLPGHEQAIAPALDSTAMIETLQHELQLRNEEIARLHTLLEVQARALEAAVERPALPEQVHPPAGGEITEADPPAATPSDPSTPWQRVMRWLHRT